MYKTQKVTAIPWFYNNGDQEKLTEHNSSVEANTSEAGISSEVKISLSFQRWNVIITRGIVLQYSIFLFVLFPAVFLLLLLEVRAFEADRFDRLNFFLIKVRTGTGSCSSCHRCFLFDRELTHCCNKCFRQVPHLLYALWCLRHRW